jgi:hypothetical protein
MMLLMYCQDSDDCCCCSGGGGSADNDEDVLDNIFSTICSFLEEGMFWASKRTVLLELY